MALILFIIESCSIIYFDRKFYGTYYTPAIALSLPMILISILAVAFAQQIGFYSIYLPIFYLWSIGLLFFWLGGIMLSMIICRRGNKRFPAEHYLKLLLRSRKKILYVGIAMAIYIDIYIYINLLRFNFVFDDDWENVISTGMFAHISLFFKLISIFAFSCISSRNKKIFNIGYVYIFLSALLLATLYTVKSGILILLLSAILLRIYIYNVKFKIKYFAYLLLLAFIIFFLSYSLVFGYWAPFDFIINHTIFYFTSSIASFSQYLYHENPMGVSFQFLFMPFFNLYNKIMGLPMQEVISDLWTQIGADASSNVKTFFGTVFIYGGYLGGIFTSFIWGIVAYFSFIMSVKGYWIFSANTCLIITALFFGWFDLYFNTFAYYEYFFYTVMLFLCNLCFVRKK